MGTEITATIGPILFLDDVRAREMRLSALFITERDAAPPPGISAGNTAAHPVAIAGFDRATVWRARFSLPTDRPSGYFWNGEAHAVASDLRLASVSCNGEEVGDLDREGSERNVM